MNLKAAALAALIMAPAWAGAGERADIRSFSGLPVVHEGRVKPIDSVARTSLMVLRGKQTVRHEGRTITASEWLLDMTAFPLKANGYQVLRIDDPEVKTLLGITERKRRYFSMGEINGRIGALEIEARRAQQIAVKARSRFEGAVLSIWNKINLYFRIQNSFQPVGTEDVSRDILRYQEKLKQGRDSFAALRDDLISWAMVARSALFLTVPGSAEGGPDEWMNSGEAVVSLIHGGEIPPALKHYGAMIAARREGRTADFNREVAAYKGWLAAHHPDLRRPATLEVLFNRAEPFYYGMIFYVCAFLAVFLSWLFKGGRWEGLAFYALCGAFLFHTGGLLGRMIIEARPPVTNLYSSAVFVGWVAAGLGLWLERRFRGGLGTLSSSIVGFTTLIVAHHLTSSGDTMEMMRAVLDSNFWLGTHVVTITIGYGACFLAGILAHVYILRGVLTPSLERSSALDISRMTYGVICFGLFFSFVGTVLGGIWADQSWGRFWGWDPKENGALLIVLWLAIILHARWAGFIRDRGLMVMAVFGNIVTSISWFGVNMLGVGLHSYGFMDKALVALVSFISVQAVVMAVGSIPLQRWRSRGLA